MSPSTTPEAPAATEASDVDVSQFGIPEPNIDSISVASQLGVIFGYKGFAPTGIAIPNASDPKFLGLNGLHTIQGHLQVGQVYSVSYAPAGPETIVMRKTARYVGTKFGVARFDVV